MRTMMAHRLIGIAGLIVVLGAVAFVAYGASIDCTGHLNCIGTDSDDTLMDSDDTNVMRGLGGDDNIDVSEDSNAGKLVSGGPGDDSINLRNGFDNNDTVTIFGDDGNDTIRLGESAIVIVDGGRGDDLIRITAELTSGSNLTDGPGRDIILDTGSNDDSDYTIALVGDNEQDTVRLVNNNGNQTIRLDRNSGRDIIDCQDLDNDDSDDYDVVFLNGNRKAVDPMGNNLHQAALSGGTAESNCHMIVP